MNVRKFTDSQQFKVHVEPFLLQQEAANNLILGILTDIGAGVYSDPYLACVEDDDDHIVLVAIRTPPYSPVLSTTTRFDSLPIIAKDLHETYTTLPGVSALEDIADAFVKQWQSRTDQTTQVRMHQGIYQLETIQLLNLPKGALREVRDDDKDLLVDWTQAFMSDTSVPATRENAEATLERLLQRRSHGAGLFVWDVDGQPVSMAAYVGGTPNGYRVTYVYTPPEHRRKGYATACTAGVTQHALATGKQYCFLYTDLSNPTSNHIYQKIGYRFVCNVKQYAFA